jgi:Tfp pilus assembly protein PilX
MKLFKVVFVLIALFLMVLGGFALYGLFFVLLKWAVILGVIALAGVGALKLMSKPDRDSPMELSSAEAEMMKAERMLAELKRGRLTK